MVSGKIRCAKLRPDKRGKRGKRGERGERGVGGGATHVSKKIKNKLLKMKLKMTDYYAFV